MPAETQERSVKAASVIVSKHSGRIFRTVENFGPFKKSDPELGGKPNVFTDREFARLHPIPPSATDIDPGTYHDDLIDRGLAMGCIVFAPNDVPTPTPLGPGNSYRGDTNPIRESTAALLAQKKDRQSIAEASTARDDGQKKPEPVVHGTIAVAKK